MMMKKTRSVYLFILGTVFGFSFTSLASVLIIDHYYVDKLYVPVDNSSIIGSIKNSLRGFGDPKFQKFDEIWETLNSNYYYTDKLDYDKSVENAKKGFVDAVGDPFTTYFNKKDNDSFKTNLKGTQDFEGIGAVVSKKNEGVLIEEVIKGSPAYNAGLMHLDTIIQVNGEDISKLPLNEIVDNKLRGPKGSEVEVTIYRDSEKKVFKVKLTRDKISIPSVSSKTFDLANSTKVGYIEISTIGEDTENSFQKAIVELKSQNVKGMILDLRGNGGGFVPIAVEIASHFVPKDKIITQTKYKSLPSEDFKSLGFGDLEKTPIIILVDGLTASASEIIALALKENNGAKTLGTKTFGKGSIQTIYDLKDGSSLKYTIGRWYSPSGKTIDHTGIEPDIKVEFDKDSFTKKQVDNQLEKAKDEILKMIKK